MSDANDVELETSFQQLAFYLEYLLDLMSRLTGMFVCECASPCASELCLDELTHVSGQRTGFEGEVCIPTGTYLRRKSIQTNVDIGNWQVCCQCIV